MTFLLLVAGGLVTSTESGLSVPDWPLSYGTLNPPMIGGIRYEHSHRLIAGAVGILTLILTVWVFAREKRPWVRGLGAAALTAVIAQAVLGGLTVLYLLPKPVSIAHACLGQTFFCLVAALALVMSPLWREGLGAGAHEAAAALKPVLTLLTGALYIQLILGATVRHAALGHAGVGLHILMAFVVVVLALFSASGIATRVPSAWARVPAAALAGLVLAQIFLGIGAFIFTFSLEKAAQPRIQEVIFATAHQATGALILVTSVLLTLLLWRTASLRGQTNE